MTPLEKEILPTVQQLRLVIGGLVVSPVLFVLFTLVAPIHPLEPEAARVLTSIALVTGLVALVTYNPIGRYLAKRSAHAVGLERAEEEPSTLAGAYLSGEFVSSAICEGAAFVNLIAFWVTRSPYGIAMAALLILAAIRKYPTLPRVAEWVRHMTAELKA